MRVKILQRCEKWMLNPTVFMHKTFNMIIVFRMAVKKLPLNETCREEGENVYLKLIPFES